MNKYTIQFFICVLFVTSCMPAQPIGVHQDTLTPSITLLPSKTLAPTRMPLPSRTVKPSLPPWPTLTPSMTSTPQPTLVAHNWRPESILVSYESRGGFCNLICPPSPAPFILYGDGTLIISRIFELNGEYQHRYFYKKLSKNGICELLNTIDQLGFLDFNEESYSVGKGIYDASTLDLIVNAWRKKSVSLYALGDLVRELEYFGEFPKGTDAKIPPSVLNTFILLDNYPLDGFTEYTEPLGVWIWKPSDNYESIPWVVNNYSLDELYQKAGSPIGELPDPVRLSEKAAKDVYAGFNNSVYYGAITDGDNTYQIYVRPIFPFEEFENGESVISPSSYQLNMRDEMQCTPSDGIMTIPAFESK